MCGSWLRATIVGLPMYLGSVIIAAQSPARATEAAKLKNPASITPESIAAGKKIFGRYCATCHGLDAKGGPSIGDAGPPPPNLTDDRWDHGSSDGEIYHVIKYGTPPDLFMEPWEDRISDLEHRELHQVAGAAEMT